MPASVSAIRAGALPSRGSGVTVFVTKASKERATSGAASASRHPEALSSRIQNGSFDTEAPQLAVDLDRAAVAGAEAAGHRGLPGELRPRGDPAHRLQHRLGAAGEHVAPTGDEL